MSRHVWIARTRGRAWVALSPTDAGAELTDCIEARNVVCKHVEASDTYYVDLGPILVGSEIISSVTSVTAADAALTVTADAVLTSQTVVTDEYGQSLTIEADTGISFALAGGTENNGTSIITVVFVKDSGKTDAIDLVIDVLGTDV